MVTLRLGEGGSSITQIFLSCLSPSWVTSVVCPFLCLVFSLSVSVIFHLPLSPHLFASGSLLWPISDRGGQIRGGGIEEGTVDSGVLLGVKG